MQQTQFQHYLKLYIFLAVALGVVQMATYQSHRQPSFPSSNQTLPNGTTPSNLSSINPSIKIFTTRKLQSIIRTILQENSLNPTIQPHELKGIDWLFSICLDYGHIVLCLFLYNSFKSEGAGGKKFRIMIFGALAVFGWIYMANNFGIERITIMKGGEVIYYQDGGFDQERFEAFVRGNRGEFEEKKEEVQGAEGTEVKEQEVITADGTAKEETSNAKILDVEIDETGNVYTPDDQEM